MRKYYKFFGIVCSFLMVAFITEARADLQIDITRGSVRPVPVAIQAFAANDPALAKLGQDMREVIANNLKNSGLFDVIPENAHRSIRSSVDQKNPVFPEWKALNVEGLVNGVVERTADNRTRVEFRLWDVNAERQMVGLAYMTTTTNWRRIAHIISDEIYKRITGEDGYFDTRIVYVAETGPETNRVKRLAIMDQDGANHQYLTDGRSLVLTPRFSPSSQTIAYMSYERGIPRVYIYDLNTGRQRVLGDFQGMTFAPRFSPDGNNVVMSLAQGGRSDIYLLDLRNQRKRALTNHPGIDTSPSFSADGKYIAFESDRSGTQQIYVMNADGSNVKRITFGEGRYATPVWSPRGDLIAFTKMRAGQFYIGVIRPDGTGERLITQAFHIEGPTWSPNGRVLSYFKETSSRTGKTSRVHTIDLTGYNERTLPTPAGASDPAWSPINP